MEKPKYVVQRDDEAQRLGLDISPTREEAAVFIDSISGEGITLGTAIKQVAPKITVFGDMIGEKVTYIIEDGKIYQGGSAVRPLYCVNENNRFGTFFHGNYGNFKGVSGNKRLTSAILKNAGISVPREINLSFNDYSPKDMYGNRDYGSISNDEEREITNKRTTLVREFCKSLGKGRKIVLKPIDGQCGRKIFIGKYEDILFELMHKDEYSIEGDILVQEKIDSYPIFDEQGNRKDWNVRVLTTTDEKGNTIVAGITGRIDNDGGPVNRSISADNISLKDIGKLAGLSDSSVLDIKRKIEETAIKSIDSLKSKIKSKKPFDSQDLAGVDIIIGEDLEPCVIEVNDSDSGCIYELMCLEGIESIHPIAKSIVRKVKLGYYVLGLSDIFKSDFGDFTDRLIQHILIGDIKIEDIDGGISLVGSTDDGNRFLEFSKTLRAVQLEEEHKSL